MRTMGGMATSAIRRHYQEHGYAVVDEPVLDADLVARAAADIPRIIDGDYPSGEPPARRYWNPGDDPGEFVKIDQVHVCAPALREVAGHHAIGRYAAAATRAGQIQLWASQLVVKPSSPGTGTALGWHQDDLYWQGLWEGEVFTCWVALSEVGPAAGPVTYIDGSHRWPVVSDADFRDHDLDGLRARLQLPADAEWTERPALLPAGGIALHHKRTMHASRANTSGGSRLGLALHLRTERSTPADGAAELFSFDLTDRDRFPVLYPA